MVRRFARSYGLGDVVGPPVGENVPETPSRRLSLAGPINTRYSLISQLCDGKNIPTRVPIDRFRPGDAEYRNRGWHWALLRPEKSGHMLLRIMCGGDRETLEASMRCDATRHVARAYIRQPAGPARRIRKQTLVQFGAANTRRPLHPSPSV